MVSMWWEDCFWFSAILWLFNAVRILAHLLDKRVIQKPLRADASLPGHHDVALATPPQCSRKCGKGQRRRTVVCRRSEPGGQAGVLPDSSCMAEPKPSAQEPCMLKRCPKRRKAQWLVSSWQQVQEPRWDTQHKHPKEVRNFLNSD